MPSPLSHGIRRKVYASLYERISSLSEKKVPPSKLKSAIMRAFHKNVLSPHDFVWLRCLLELRSRGIKTPADFFLKMSEKDVYEFVSEMHAHLKNFFGPDSEKKYMFKIAPEYSNFSHFIYGTILPEPYREFFVFFTQFSENKNRKVSVVTFHRNLKKALSIFGENLSGIIRLILKLRKANMLKDVFIKDGIFILSLDLPEIGIKDFIAIENVENGKIKVGDGNKYLVLGTEAEKYLDRTFYAKKEAELLQRYEAIAEYLSKMFR